MLRRKATALLAIFICAVLYGVSRLPELSDDERAELADRFKFTGFPLPEKLPGEVRSVRAVHPSLSRISAWISSVGAAVALADLDGDGLANDLCHIDTRTDQVAVAPVPGTGERFESFALDPRPLPVDETIAPMGCLPGDLNQDGWSDLLVYYWGRPPVLFLRDGRRPLSGPAFRPEEIAGSRQRWHSNAATLADVDGDGRPDLVLTNYFPDGSRILDPHADGVQRMQHSMSNARNGGRNRLFLWRGQTHGDPPGVAFSEAPRAFGEAATAWTLAVGAADLDGDCLPEIYFANDFGPDHLFHNRSRPGRPDLRAVIGARGLTVPKSKILGRDSFKGMGVDFGDLNRDGWPDIYVSNIAADFALHESHFLYMSTGETEAFLRGVAPYHDQSESLGLSRSDWGWESKLADFDNDGVAEAVQATGFIKGRADRWPELHELAMGNDELVSHPGSWPRFQPSDGLSGEAHNPFFVRARDGRYYDIAPDLGLGAPQISRGIAVADVDGDGDLDFAVANQWERSFFYRNDSPRQGSFLGLHLLIPASEGAVGRTSARPGHPRPGEGWPALGATAKVFLDGRLLQSAQLDGGNGHSGVRAPQLHFGLGGHPPGEPVEVLISWRDTKGRLHHQRLLLQPGWHTVTLGGWDDPGGAVAAAP